MPGYSTLFHMACSHTHRFVTCLVLEAVPVFWPSYAPAKVKRIGHLRLLTEMSIFLMHITVHRVTNSGKFQVQNRLAFSERDNNFKFNKCDHIKPIKFYQLKTSTITVQSKKFDQIQQFPTTMNKSHDPLRN